MNLSTKKSYKRKNKYLYRGFKSRGSPTCTLTILMEDIQMLNKKERTLDVYKRAGAEMRLFKTLGAKLATDISKVMKSGDTDMLLRALDKVDIICSRAEDNMFRDFPDISSDYIDVFYGCTKNDPRNEVDAEMVSLAKEVADGLFE